jgi:hypothetical protein
MLVRFKLYSYRNARTGLILLTNKAGNSRLMRQTTTTPAFNKSNRGTSILMGAWVT